MSVREVFKWGAPDDRKELVRAGKMLAIGTAFGQSRVLGVTTPGWYIDSSLGGGSDGLYVYRLQSQYLRVSYKLDAANPGDAQLRVYNYGGAGGPGTTLHATLVLPASGPGIFGPFWDELWMPPAVLDAPVWMGVWPGSGPTVSVFNLIIIEMPERVTALDPNPWTGS